MRYAIRYTAKRVFVVREAEGGSWVDSPIATIDEALHFDSMRDVCRAIEKHAVAGYAGTPIEIVGVEEVSEPRFREVEL